MMVLIILIQQCPPSYLCTEDEVFNLLASLDSSKSTGPDGVSAKMLKETATSITYSLTKLFTQSISKGVFPSDWKIARTVPIPKSADKSLLKNYRPISVLPLVSKLLEKHIHTLIHDHLISFHPISQRQCGFMTGRSTTSALLTVTLGILCWCMGPPLC